jgi:hypothetical protein
VRHFRAQVSPAVEAASLRSAELEASLLAKDQALETLHGKLLGLQVGLGSQDLSSLRPKPQPQTLNPEPESLDASPTACQTL